MKTTIEIPDDLFRQLKMKAVQEGRSMKDLLTELLRRGLSTKMPDRSKEKPLPIIQCKPAKPGEEITPERVAEILYGSSE
jgi:plasmid stability protein